MGGGGQRAVPGDSTVPSQSRLPELCSGISLACALLSDLPLGGGGLHQAKRQDGGARNPKSLLCSWGAAWPGGRTGSPRGGEGGRPGLCRLRFGYGSRVSLEGPARLSADPSLGGCHGRVRGNVLGPQEETPHAEGPAAGACAPTAWGQTQGGGRAGSSQLGAPRGSAGLSPSSWRPAGDLGGSLACRCITPTSAHVFTWPLFCACLQVPASASQTVPCHAAWGPALPQGDLVLMTPAAPLV